MNEAEVYRTGNDHDESEVLEMRRATVIFGFILICLPCLFAAKTFAAYPEFTQHTYSEIEKPDLQVLYKIITQQDQLKLGDTREQVSRKLGEAYYSKEYTSKEGKKEEYAFFNNGFRLYFENQELVYIYYWNLFDNGRFGSVAFSEIRHIFGKADELDEEERPLYTGNGKTVRFFGSFYFEGYVIREDEPGKARQER